MADTQAANAFSVADHIVDILLSELPSYDRPTLILGWGKCRVGSTAITNLFGMVMYGGPAFEARHADILATFYKGTTKHHTVRRVRFVTADVAIVDIDNEVRGVTAMPAGIVVPADGVVRTQLMEVFVRRDGRWWVDAYHNVDVKPGATSR